MSKTTGLFAASVAALIVACIAGAGAVSGTQARVAAPQINPLQVMTSATQMPVQHFVDYSLVFN